MKLGIQVDKNASFMISQYNYLQGNELCLDFEKSVIQALSKWPHSVPLNSSMQTSSNVCYENREDASSSTKHHPPNRLNCWFYSEN